LEKQEETRYVKRTQKDYSMSFKLQIVQELERGQFTATESAKTYGIQNRTTVVNWLKKKQLLLGKPNTIYYVKVARTKNHGA
jgi:transposase